MKLKVLTSSLLLVIHLVSSQNSEDNNAACILSGYKDSDSDSAKQDQLKKFTISDDGTQETTQFGAKINNSDSLKAGLDGPTLMEDFMMREKIMHFG